MPHADLLLAFFVATFLFAYIPGPAMLYAAAQTLARGRRAGLMAELGLHLGGYAHVFAAAAGLSVLFHTVPTLYVVVKLAGAAYLIWLGLTLFRGKDGELDLATLVPAKSARRAFADSVLIELLNPKTAIFFLAFLPQFVDPAANWPVWVQFAVLGTLANLIFSSVDIVAVLLAGYVVNRLRAASGTRRLMQRLSGSLLMGLGAHLALERS
ncbi:LysE family translocator [Oryzibacter oryziterrae]|uniref:LysE family translocator n=1 Tax=Oryzibacter oryziterrae TaxID=2766474 RepID=UPI001F2CAA8E|nr:LysE family translocator [Oryzibacter oryziterrae]